MAGEFDGRVKIVAVDVDKSSEVAQEFGISAMPTLVLMKDSKEVARIEGANETRIREMIQNAL